MVRDLSHVAVVGSSLAGLRACESLRSEGFTGRITLIGAETHHPYDRPPLSKRLLAGEWEPERIALRSPASFAELDLDLRLGVAATALDPDGRSIALADGTEVGFDAAVLATGTVPRRLPGQPDWVHEVRTLDDALRLRSELVAGRRLVVVGAGFIGLEVAATARQLGLEVTVLEGAPAPLIRGLGAEMGGHIAAIHARQGVPVRCAVTVDAIEPGAVRLGSGEVIACDLVVVGVGVRPATDWLAGSGLAISDGIVCDPFLQTSTEGVAAAGDAVRWHNALFDEEMRIEHWTNAAEQGALAAANLLRLAAGDEPVAYSPVPFFWSDQYDARIQFLGRSSADDEVVVAWGSPDDERFLALYRRGDRLHGALGVSCPRLLMPLRKLLLAQASWADALEHCAGLP